MPPADARGLVRPLTSLRFLAATWVLLHHALPRGGPGSVTEAVGATGWLGVSLFFVLSGFLLTVRYAPAGALRGPRRDFWLERVARLVPAYLLSLAFAAPLFARDARVQALAPGRVAATAVTVLTGQQAWRPETACTWNCPAWSLSVEFWFYAAFPAVVALAGAWLLGTHRRARGAALLCASLAAAALVFPGLERAGAGWPLPVYSLSPLARWPEFLAGIALAAVIGEWRPRGAAPGWGLFATGLAWIATAVALRDAVTAIGAHLLPAALPGFVLVVAACWALRDRPAPGLDAAPLVLLGEASYALYLFHAPLHSYVLALANRLVGRGYDASWALFAAYVALALAVALAVHRFVELPWRRRLRVRWGLGGRA